MAAARRLVVGENTAVVSSSAQLPFLVQCVRFQRWGELRSRVGVPSPSIAGPSCDPCHIWPTVNPPPPPPTPEVFGNKCCVHFGDTTLGLRIAESLILSQKIYWCQATIRAKVLTSPLTFVAVICGRRGHQSILEALTMTAPTCTPIPTCDHILVA